MYSKTFLAAPQCKNFYDFYFPKLSLFRIFTCKLKNSCLGCLYHSKSRIKCVKAEWLFVCFFLYENFDKSRMCAMHKGQTSYVICYSLQNKIPLKWKDKRFLFLSFNLFHEHALCMFEKPQCVTHQTPENHKQFSFLQIRWYRCLLSVWRFAEVDIQRRRMKAG